MKIDRTNYESYLIDYLEGNLSDDLRHRVEIFLAANPDIAEEFESAKIDQPVPVDSPSVDKESIYHSYSDIKNIPESKFEEFCVAYHEGDLDDEGKSRLLSLIKNDAEKKKIFDLFGAIRLSYDPAITYPSKSKLRKPFTLPLRRIFYIGTAAAAALLVGFLAFFPRQGEIVNDQQAEQTFPARRESSSVTEDISLPASSGEMPVSPAVFEQQRTRKLLAKADSNTHPLPETIILASLEPIPATLENELPASVNTITVLNRPEAIASIENAKSQSLSRTPATRYNSQNMIISRETIFWTAVKASVKGFNSLTENDLALYTEQNKKGEVTGIKIYAENFQFQRRFKRNIQN